MVFFKIEGTISNVNSATYLRHLLMVSNLEKEGRGQVDNVIFQALGRE